MAEGKASFSNMTVEAEVTVFQRKNDDEFVKNISNSDDYDVLIVQAYTKGRNYNGHEWTRFYSVKILGFATKNFEDSVKPGDLLRIRGEFDINDWMPKDAGKDDEPVESEVLVIDPHKGGYWAHCARWDTTTLNRDEDGGNNKRSSRSRRDDDEGDDEPRGGRSSRSRGRAKDDDDGDDEPRSRNRGRSRDKDDDEGDDDDAPRRGRSRSRAADDDEGDDEPRGRSRGRSRSDDDGDDEPSPRGRNRRTRGRGDSDDD